MPILSSTQNIGTANMRAHMPVLVVCIVLGALFMVPLGANAASLPALDFQRYFPYIFWVSHESRDKEFPDGFVYKFLSVKDETEGQVYMELVRETPKGKEELLLVKGSADKAEQDFDKSVAGLGHDLNITFEKFDLREIRTREAFDAKAVALGWKTANLGPAAPAVPKIVSYEIGPYDARDTAQVERLGNGKVDTEWNAKGELVARSAKWTTGFDYIDPERSSVMLTGNKLTLCYNIVHPKRGPDDPVLMCLSTAVLEYTVSGLSPDQHYEIEVSSRCVVPDNEWHVAAAETSAHGKGHISCGG